MNPFSPATKGLPVGHTDQDQARRVKGKHRRFHTSAAQFPQNGVDSLSKLPEFFGDR
jgi:hypothetical protein